MYIHTWLLYEGNTAAHPHFKCVCKMVLQNAKKYVTMFCVGSRDADRIIKQERRGHMDELIQMGIRIKERRKSAGLTLEELADKIGVAASTVQRYENGRISRPKLPVVKAIADALGCTADYLAGITDTAESNAPLPVRLKLERFAMDDDSMAPFIMKGDIIEYEPSDSLESGLLVCAAGGRTSVCSVTVGSEITLSHSNPYYPPRVIPISDRKKVTVLGRAVRLIRPLTDSPVYPLGR